MKKIIRFIPFILTAICFISYNIKGSYIDSNGFLIEPFFLIPLAYIFFFIGIILNAILLIKNLNK